MWSRYLSRISMKSCWYIDASVRSFFRCTNSSTIFGGLIHQGGEKKYEGVSKMSESLMLEAVKNCLIRRPKVHIAFGIASNNFIYLLSNTASCVWCLGSYLILEQYCRDSLARLASKQGSCASTYKLSTAVLNAPRQSLRPCHRCVYRIKHLQISLTSWPIHNASII